MKTNTTSWPMGTRVAWTLMVLGVLATVLLSSRYFSFNPDVYFQRETYLANEVPLFVHIVAMFVAILLGPLQFLPGFRARHPRVHRTLGKLYIGGAVVGALSGLWLAPVSASGAISGVSFVLLAMGTLITTVQALLLIRRRRIEEHRAWMMRSFALILAGLTLRLYLKPLYLAFDDYTAYAIVAWACWVPNILVAEWMIRRRATPRQAASDRPLQPARAGSSRPIG